jgi:hypothetical protein
MARYRKSGYYNDPAIGQAFSNLANMFAPPDGGEAAGWATANATNQKAQRLADFFKYAQAPGVDRGRLDAMGVGAGVYQPNQSYYAVDTGNATNIAMNDADNSTAILTNKADNERALRQTGMEQEGQTYRKKLEPFAVNKDQLYFASPEAQEVFPSLPATGVNLAATEADNANALARTQAEQAGALERKKLEPFAVNKDQFFYASPEAQQTFGAPAEGRGIVSVNPGEAAVMPWGGRIEGAPKPLTESEKTAEILGTLSPEDQRNRALQGVPVETVQRADGTPEIVNRTDAVGRTPAPPPGTKLETQNYLEPQPDGTYARGTAYFDQGRRRWIDTADGRLLAPSATFSGQLSSAESTSFGGATGANLTKAGGLMASADAAEGAIRQYVDLLEKNPGIVGTPGFVRGVGQNAVQVLSELQQAWGDTIDANSPISLDQVKQAVTAVSGNYDPNIQAARVLESEIAYRYAQLLNPSGEVSRQAFERAMETVKGGTLPNNASALAGVNQILETTKRARREAEMLRSPPRPGQGAAAEAATTAAPSSAAAPAGAPAGPRTIQTPHGTVTIQRVQ